MAGIKGKTGLTRGRGFTELNHLTWVLSRPIVCKLNEKISEMTETGIGGSIGQSAVKSCRVTRVSRDWDDILKLKDFFSERLVFDPYVVSTKLMNIATGLVAPEKVDVHKAFQIGSKIIKSLEGQNPLNAKIEKEDLAVQFPSTAAAVLKYNTSSTVQELDPNLLFQRALALSSSTDVDTTLEECLKFELSPYPMSLFDETGFLRTNTKAEMAAHLIEKYEPLISFNKNHSLIVLDGGALLHRVQWEKGTTFGQIIENYNRYIRSNYNYLLNPLIVVFDGYNSSTKDQCHRKRHPVRGMEIVFGRDTMLLCKKTTFLSNPINKTRFVDMLGRYLTQCLRIKVLYSQADADLLIVTTAMEEVMTCNTTVVGDDTDLLVLLLHYVHTIGCNIYDLALYRPSSDTCIDVKKLHERMPTHVVDSILTIHAASGCDTVSAIFGIGKTKLLKICEKNVDGMVDLKEFYHTTDHSNKVNGAGLRLLIKLYDKDEKHGTMESLRFW